MNNQGGIIMKNLFKLVIIAFFSCFMAFFISCSESGGTIIIKNNYSEEKTVTVYSDFSITNLSVSSMISYKDKYGPNNISADSTGTIIVKNNTHYGIVWHNGDVDAYKSVDVANGEIVEVIIPW